LKGKINSTVFLKGYYVVLLRYNVKRRKLVILRKSSRLGRLAGSVVEYVSSVWLDIVGVSTTLDTRNRDIPSKSCKIVAIPNISALIA
jgi:hypothetical protein